MLLIDVSDPRPRCERTELIADGRSGCLVVAPVQGGYHRLGRRVVNGLREWTGVVPELRAPAEVGEADLREHHLILVGNAVVNELIWALYRRHLCFTDAFYPGGDDFEIRTIHDPWGTRRNVLLLGGSTEEGANRAAVSFNRSLRQAPQEQVVMRRLNFACSRQHVPFEPDAATRRHLLEDAFEAIQPRRAEPARMWDVLHRACDVGLYYYQTDRQGWCDIFRALVLGYSEVAQQEGDWWLGTGVSQGAAAWQWKLATVWDLIEESPLLSDGERLLVERLLLAQAGRLAAWLLHPDAGGDSGSVAPHLATAAALGLHRLLALLERGHGATALKPVGVTGSACAATFATCRERIRQILGREAARVLTTPSADRWQVAEHLVAFWLEENEYGMLESGFLRELGALCLASVDSLGREVDPVNGVRPVEMASALMNLLLKAACYERNPELLVFREWLRAGRAEMAYSPGEPSRSWCWYTGRWDCGLQPEAPTSAPARLIAAGMAGGSPASFQVLCCRREAAAAGECLLVGGQDWQRMGGTAASSLLRLTWLGHSWLADPGTPAGRRHGMQIVSGGRTVTGSEGAVLGVQVDLPGMSYVRIGNRLREGVGWQRHILWEKGARFLVVDAVTSPEPSGCRAELTWSLAGVPQEFEHVLVLRQDDAAMGIWHAGSSQQELALLEADGGDAGGGDHACQLPVHLWRQQEVTATAGPVVFINLVQPFDPALRVRRVGEEALLLSREDHGMSVPLGCWGVACGAGQFELGRVSVKAQAFVLRPGWVELAAALHLGGEQAVLAADTPVDCQLDLKAGEAYLQVADPTTLRLLAAGARLDGELLTGRAGTGGVLSVKLSPGVHRITGLDGGAFGERGWLAQALAFDLLAL